MNNEQELLKLLLPEYFIEYFDIIKFEKKENQLHLYFEEKAVLLKSFQIYSFNLKGFTKKLLLTTFHFEEKL